MDKPTEVETSRWTKIALVKACKAFGVNAAGFEHDILGIILRMGERRKAQLLLQQQQAKAVASPRKGKNKGEAELKKLAWGLQEGNDRKVRGVYGPHTNPERKEFWHELAAIGGLWSDQWVIGGDFNACRYESERLNCSRRSRAMIDFSNFILELGLIDPPLNGVQYTWSRGENFTQASRIDRFLHSTEWGDSFKAVKQLSMPKVISNHKPILLESGDWEPTPSYFKFENMWLQTEGSMDMIKEWWQSYTIIGSLDYILIQKLRSLKKDITTWNREVHGKLEDKRNKALCDDPKDECVDLESSFEESEVLAALKSCAPDKVPGPDGFTMAFFQKAWDFFKTNIMKALNHFYHSCHTVKSCNAAFIALISKRKGAIELKDYRPISLTGSVYKIAAKILVERLKKIIAKLISGQQSAFIKNRQITHASLIANEVLDWRIKSGETGLLCKLDIEKAFDQLSWAYLTNILKKMEFGDRSPVGFFSPHKGLRQGDQLSPFLFILAMEGLSHILGRAKELRWIQGFQVGRNPANSVTVSHLLYANDTLIFCDTERSQVINLNLILLIFEVLSGLHINMLKSIIYPVNEVQNLEDLAEILSCKTGSFPTTYLGLPLGAKFKSTGI
uniref:Reverse transcriptase domain-containing protein n=1 Tax=Nicotiana tabacum TaxID=4097 RepID=A0A1S3YBG0_TOBAC|nr:uncharacterized protein LOC104104150 [Nicotiana tomentosiformis]XP_016449348.1 PREDICTED: uncharacterized protein LOC107774363 [Nicotiana tabacum]